MATTDRSAAYVRMYAGHISQPLVVRIRTNRVSAAIKSLREVSTRKQPLRPLVRVNLFGSSPSNSDARLFLAALVRV